MPSTATKRQVVAAPSGSDALRWELAHTILCGSTIEVVEVFDRCTRLLEEHFGLVQVSLLLIAKEPVRRGRERREGKRPVRGWFPVAGHRANARPQHEDFVTRWKEAGEYATDPAVMATLRGAGRDRGYIQTHAELEQGSPVERLFEGLGIGSRLVLFANQSPQLETCLMLDRRKGDAPFTPAERDEALDAMPALKRQMRRICQRWGWLDAQEPLTPRERELVHLLLQGLSEAECAERLGLKTSSTHQLVVKVFRKLRVNSRPQLMAQMLG